MAPAVSYFSQVLCTQKMMALTRESGNKLQVFHGCENLVERFLSVPLLCLNRVLCKTVLKNEGKDNQYITTKKDTQKMKTICNFHSQKKEKKKRKGC